MKRKRYYAVQLDLWDCNRHPYTVWNIVDRKVDRDRAIAQAWSKESRDLIIKKLNK